MLKKSTEPRYIPKFLPKKEYQLTIALKHPYSILLQFTRCD